MFDIGSRPRKQFDFDNGYLIQSPCKHCHQRAILPKCRHRCHILDMVQRHLALGVDTSFSNADVEPYAILLDEGRVKTSY